MDAQTAERYAADPMAFLDDLIIPGARGAVRFGDVMAPFQRERFAALVPALLAVARGKQPPIGRHWWEATKGASKDSDLAAALLWLLVLSRRPLECQIGAADADQADELRKAARAILHLNPWLAAWVDVQSSRLVCEKTGATATIIAADVAGSHGARPDVLILNELSHVTKREFAENLADNAAKVPHGLMIVATNAGNVESWQYRWREIARTTPERWGFHLWARPAPWLDAAEIKEAKRRNSVARYLRLFEGVSSRGGDALDAASIEDAITLDGPDLIPNDDFGHCIGLDLSTKRDHSAVVVLGGDWRRRRVRLAHCESWAPVDGQVDLQAVQTTTENLARRYGATVYFDPHQAHLMAQQLRSRGIHCVEVPFVGQNLNRMASAVLQTFRERRIDLYRDDALLADLSKLSIVERSFGYKLEAPADEMGHADRAFALAIALPAALEASGRSRVIIIDPPEQFRQFTPWQPEPAWMGI